MRATAPSLLCLPCAGASAVASFAHWNKATPFPMHVRPVELPGRGVRMAEQPLRDFSALARDLASTAAKLVSGDYILFGHSFGALLAFECAHRLAAAGLHAPLALVVACCSGPRVFDNARFKRPWSEEELERELISLNAGAADLVEHAALRQLILRQMESDFSVLATLNLDLARPKLSCPVLVLGGASDTISFRALESWGEVSTAETVIELQDGDHFFFQRDPARLLALISDRLGLRAAEARLGAYQ